MPARLNFLEGQRKVARQPAQHLAAARSRGTVIKVHHRARLRSASQQWAALCRNPGFLWLPCAE